MTETHEQRVERLAKVIRLELVTMANCLQDPCLREPCECAAALARAAIASDTAAGLATVPLGPTAAMLQAGVDADDKRTGYQTSAHIYRAMLAANPLKPEK